MTIKHVLLTLGLALPLLVTHTPALSALPNCELDNSDSDGDGFGWENSSSCRVPVNLSTLNHPDCRRSDSDPDGDGFGWENGVTCLITTEMLTSVRPNCQSSDSDPDNDGFGWENGATCLMQQQSSISKPACSQADSDADGDGFGWENNQSCVVSMTIAPPRPVCTSDNPDADGDGFGWENNATCIVEVSTGNGNGSVHRITALGPDGYLESGTPTFKWTALDDVDEYRIVVTDAAGNGYRRSVDAVSAGCQTSTAECRFTPNAAYFDNDLAWYIESIIHGEAGPRSNTMNITTPFSINSQPIKSNTTSCEAWPAVTWDKFVVLNNSWNSRTMNRRDWSQTIWLDQDMDGNSTPTWTYDWLGRHDGGEIEVKAYPEVIYGSKLGTHVSGSTAQTGLPELVRDLPEFTVRYSYTETGNAERNVALESFFHDSCDIAGPCDEVDNRVYEMMIWVNNPTIRTPGKLALNGVLIDNQLWNVYIKPNSNKHYIAFTAQNPQTSGTLNWNRFVDWTENWTAANAEALGINVLSEDFCMGAIELGTEMWWGSGSFTLNDYEISYR